MKYDELKNLVTKSPARSAWQRGVRTYAIELLDLLDDEDYIEAKTAVVLKKLLLNGASDEKTYSYDGHSLWYDGDIARRLCALWELRRTDYGKKPPNSGENWLDVQARAIYQAVELILNIWREHP